MLRNAALASSVVASMPIVFPFTKPAVPRHCSTQVNTARCVSRAIRRRVREIVEWSGASPSQADAEEIPRRQRIGRTPVDAALRVNNFEVPDQPQPEVSAGRQARATHRLSVEAGALAFD
jgi:hypothetical protein